MYIYMMCVCVCVCVCLCVSIYLSISLCIYIFIHAYVSAQVYSALPGDTGKGTIQQPLQSDLHRPGTLYIYIYRERERLMMDA